jgi:hypothetical protein
MRKVIGSAVIGLLGATAWPGLSWGQAPDWSLHSLPPPPSPPTRKWVHLNGVADLERLQATNLNHYLRAQPILAAANEICGPGPAKNVPTRFSSASPSCGAMWLTSHPAKKILTFHLDDVGYIALVSVTVSGGRLEPLDAQAALAK